MPLIRLLMKEKFMPPLLIKEIFADPDFNCRGKIAPIDVTDLMRSIGDHGLLQPVVVQPYTDKVGYKWRVIMGHRRLMACTLLKWTEVECIIHEHLTVAQARAENLIENLQRRDLDIIQEAKAIQKMIDFNVGVKEIAKMIGKSYGWVNIRMMALALPENIQAEIASGFINQEAIKELSMMVNPEQQFELVRNLKDAKLRGEKFVYKIVAKKPESVFTKKLRTLTDIFKLQEVIQDSIGNNFGTRCLAWAAGEISTKDIFEDIKQIALQEEVSFVEPKVL